MIKISELKNKNVLIMAGGTGGHVFPALAVAKALHDSGAGICWLGTRKGIEARILPREGFIDVHYLSVSGLRGQGIKRLLQAPFKIIFACCQAAWTLHKVKPAFVLGMGGFASGPGGLMAKLMGYPLIIHEQNAVPGVTNRILSKFADSVLQGFPSTFNLENRQKLRVTGNPVRKNIMQVLDPEGRFRNRNTSNEFNILILGGSQGALAINNLVPLALAEVMELSKIPEMKLNILHQTGKNKDSKTAALYEQVSIDARVSPFIADMAEAYGWADIVIARSGALTVSEIQQAGLAAIFIPYPSAVDDHQTKNAEILSNAGGAVIAPQQSLSVKKLSSIMLGLLDKSTLLKMARATRQHAPHDSTQAVVDACLEVANV